jgi:hypothetical protein
MQGETTTTRTPTDSATAADRRLFENICGDFGLSIARDGTWFYRGSPIGRIALVKLFASVLRRDAEGKYWLVTPVEKGTIEVADVPFVAVETDITGSGREQIVTFRTNLDDIVTLGPEHPLRVVEHAVSGEPAPYVLIRDNLEARLARPVFYALVERGVPAQTPQGPAFGIWSDGRFFRLGPWDGAP